MHISRCIMYSKQNSFPNNLKLSKEKKVFNTEQRNIMHRKMAR